MARPPRLCILDDIKAKLENIGIGSTDKTAVVTVTRRKTTDVRISPDRMPAIIIMPGTENASGLSFRQIRVTMSVDLLCFVRASDEDTTDILLEELRDDIIANLYTDVTRGANATTTRYVSSIEGTHEDDTIGQMTMTWEVEFDRSTRAS